MLRSAITFAAVYNMCGLLFCQKIIAAISVLLVKLASAQVSMTHDAQLLQFCILMLRYKSCKTSYLGEYFYVYFGQDQQRIVTRICQGLCSNCC